MGAGDLNAATFLFSNQLIGSFSPRHDDIVVFKQ